MAKCAKCGAEVEEGVKFCPFCGADMGEAPKTEEAPKAEDKLDEKLDDAKEAVEDLAKKVVALNDTEDTTADYEKEDIEKNKVMAVLSYFGLLVLIPIFAAKDSKFAKFHANQGLVLFIVEIIINAAIGILKRIMLRGLFGFIGSLLDLVLLVVAIIGIVNAAQGKAKELPVIGKFKILS